jgi:hypothetical protein
MFEAYSNPDDLKAIDAAMVRLDAAAKKYTDEKSTLVLNALCLKVNAMLKRERPISEVVAYVDKIIGNVAAGTPYLGDLPR